MDDEAIALLEQAGAPQEIIEAARHQQSDDAAYEVWPECMEIVNLFCRLATQWRWISGMSVARTGLDYTAVIGVLTMMGRTDLFGPIQAMEIAALGYWSERGK